MGNIVTMGYNAPADAEMPAQDDYVQRLSASDLKRYTEGIRRVCRVESAGDSSADSGAAIGGGHPPLPPTSTLPPKPRGNPSSNGSVNPVNGGGIVKSHGSVGVTKKLFRGKILSAFPLIPHSLADRLFEVLDTEQRGELSVETVLRGIALLKHGTREEHLHLLFTIYDLDTTGLVARETLDRFMDVIYGRKKARHPDTVTFLNRVFNGRPTLTLDEFKIIAEEQDVHGHAVLLQWFYTLSDKIGRVDDDQIVELERQYNPIVIRHRIAESTLFSTSEVSTLEKQFHKLFDTKGGASNRIPSDQFIDLFARHEFPRHILERACQPNRVCVPGMVLFEEFCQVLSNFCRGMPDAKCKHLFELFRDENEDDNDNEGSSERWLSQEAMDAFTQPLNISQHEITELNGTERTSVNGSSHHAKDDKHDASRLPKHRHSSSKWLESEFVGWASSTPAVQQMLHQMAFAACLLFGIKPDSAFLEKKIVEWHWQQATKQIDVGQTWHLLATKWWLQWCKFVGMDAANGTPNGQTLRIPQLPREAIASRDQEDGASPVGHGIIHASRPGTIANWSLLQRSGSRRLKDRLIVGQDFHLVPSAVFAVLSQWYSGGPELARFVIELPNSVKVVELLPLVLRVARVDSTNGGVILSGEEVVLSALSTVDALLQVTCKALLLTKFVDKARLWFFDENHPENKYRLRTSRPKELKRLTKTSVFLLEVQDDDGSWPLSQTTSGETRTTTTPDDDEDDEDAVDFVQTSPEGASNRRTRTSSSSLSTSSPIRRTSDICSRGNLESLTSLASTKSTSSTSSGASDAKPVSTVVEEEGLATARTLKRRFSRNAFTGSGLVGLDNLGNTCYMSSALQCMSHTRLLVDYFKNEEYLHDINLHNRDGTNGKLAVAFGELLRVLWTSEKKRFAPTEFKRVLARFNPQFSGADQHDAQELLACLLSGLSEDLNRIVSKPYTEQPDSDGRCDTVVATEWWQNHLKREFSIIVALFTGQYKSLLECSMCHYESARFEPFTFLQLSLPESSFRSVVMTVIFNNGRVPMKYSVRVRNDGRIHDVQEVVADLIRRMDKRDGVLAREVMHVVIARVSTLHTIEAILEPNTPLVRIHERDQLTAFELDDFAQAAATRSLTLAAFTSDNGNMDRIKPSPSSTRAESEHSDDQDTEEADSPSATSHTSSPSASDEPTGDASPDEVELTDTDKVVVEVDRMPFSIGTSVYVRADKTNDFLAARVIGGSTKNGSSTVDVAYPSGVRRYHISESKVLARRREEAFVFLVHRRVERSMNSFAEAHVTRLFGAPLTLRVSLRVTSNFDLYTLVWKRLHRIFNWQTPPSAETMDALLREQLARVDDDNGHDQQQQQQQELQRSGLSTVALGRHLAYTKFGFCLRTVTSHGVGCSRCEWIEGCLGCVILPSPSTRITLSAEETISIDWDIRTLKEEYDPIQASKLDTHESVQVNHRLDNMPLNIHRCLDIFTAKEPINEAYCGRCKTHRPATKTMDLWRLPPLLVIQLKRFCYTQTSRRKLQHFVDFPLTGLRLEDFVAKKRDPKRFHESGLVYWQFLGGKLKALDDDEDVNPSSPSAHPSKSTTRATSGAASLMDAPATAAERASKSFLYDLYAVVNHVGALGGGHYFAYVLSEDDNKWKCFNDHQCKEIDAKEVVSSSAYILFYRRRDMKDVSIEDLFPPIRRTNKNQAKANQHGNENGTADELSDTTADEDQAKIEELVEQTKIATNSSGCVIS